MPPITVSIIIPVYNAELYIERCLRSVLTQTYANNVECILVDDGSSDDCIEKAEQLIKHSTSAVRTHIFRHIQNKGVCAARNTGMNAATGDYLYFLDVDDEIVEDCIELLVKPLEEELYDMVIGNVKCIADDNADKILRLKLDDGSVLRHNEIINTYRIKWNMLPTNKMYRSEFLRKEHLSFKEGIAYEDELWNLKTIAVMHSMRVVGADTYIHYNIENSLSKEWGENKRKLTSDIVLIMKDMREFMQERAIWHERLYYFLQWFFNNMILTIFLDDKEAYVKKYSETVHLARYPWKQRIVSNGWNLRYHLRDFHFFLPLAIAPYWQYMLFKMIKH